MSEVFENNSKRSEKRPRYDLIPRCIIDAIADRFSLGASKFGEHNWKGGGEEFFQQTKNHLIHHFWAYLEGNKEDETSHIDHLKAVLWNAGALLWWEQQKLSPPQKDTI